jgi:hypothetical protein
VSGRLPFVYESTGAQTFFSDYRDPDPRARDVFAFHRPETLRAWASEPSSPVFKKYRVFHYGEREKDARYGTYPEIDPRLPMRTSGNRRALLTSCRRILKQSRKLAGSLLRSHSPLTVHLIKARRFRKDLHSRVITPNGYRIVAVARFEAEDLRKSEGSAVRLEDGYQQAAVLQLEAGAFRMLEAKCPGSYPPPTPLVAAMKPAALKTA